MTSTNCTHCTDGTPHPGFVMLLEATEGAASAAPQAHYWEYSRQPQHALCEHQRRRRYKRGAPPKATKRLAAHWHMELVVAPFHPPGRAGQFRTVMQRMGFAHADERRAGALTLARKWSEIAGDMGQKEPLRVYADATAPEDAESPSLTEEQSMQLVREAVSVLASSSSS